MITIFEIDGDPDEKFVMTRAQVRRLATSAYAFGEDREPMQRTFEAECGCTHCEALDYAIEENRRQFERLAAANARVSWLERLNHVTASHLRKAREKLYDLCLDNEYAQAELRLWRGSEQPYRDMPDHYAGDGLVTCDRAMESVVTQGAVLERTTMQLWWWMCAFKYVWRMWSKADPVKDAEKAIDCLGRVIRTIKEEEGGDDDE